MLRRLFAAVALSAAIAVPAQAQYVFGFSGGSPAQLVLNGSTVVNAVDQGWWAKIGSTYQHTSTNDNYFVGLNTDGGSYRNFFLFAVPNGLTITSAALRLNSYTVTTTATFALFDYLGSLTALDASTNSTDGTVYNDLGQGVFYGSRPYSSADNGLTHDIALNASAVAALNGAQGGQFAMGGRVDADLIDVPETTVPEPSTYAMMAAGLAALVIVRRRRPV